MNTLQRSIFISVITLSIIMLFTSAIANAGQISTTYSTDQTLTATMMTEIKTAVNGNDARITKAHGVKFVNDVNNQTLTGTDTVFQTLDITAPASGYLIVHAEGNRNCGTTTSSFFMSLVNTTTGDSSAARSMEANVGIWSGYNTSFVFAVSAGSNVINFHAYCSGATASGLIWITTMYGMFVPNLLP